MKILRDRGPAFIFLLLVLSGGAEWDRWNDAPTESHVMPPFAAPIANTKEAL